MTTGNIKDHDYLMRHYSKTDLISLYDRERRAKNWLLMESIVGVAFHIDGLTISLPRPACHADLIPLVAPRLVDYVGQDVQGFITNEGRYVDRREAFQLAQEAGQVMYHLEEAKSGLLASEMMWKKSDSQTHEYKEERKSDG